MMMPEDSGPTSAAGRGHLRASHADRERVLETLKTAFVQGRLAGDEFSLRMSRALESRTYADLAALTTDLPAGLAKAQPPGQPVPVDDPTRIPTALGAGACTFVWLGVILIPASFATQFFPLLVLGVICLLVASPVAGGWVLQTWRERHTGGQAPRRTARGEPPGRSQDGPAGDGNLALSLRPRRAEPRRRGASPGRATARPAAVPGATATG